MPGSPLLHGYPTSTTSQGVGGAARVQAPAVGAGNDASFFLWLAIIGILIPVLIIGGLRVGGFQFVFKHR